MNFRALLLFLSLGCIGPLGASPEKMTVDEVSYYVLRAPVQAVRIIWKDKTGAQLRTFPAAARYLAGEGVELDSLMNGGIFAAGGVPSGLLIQDGNELRPVNRSNGKGNFFLKPNGIFLIGSKGAAVLATEEFPLKDADIRCAVQSGPLLLRHGKTHPQFNASSTSRLHRNGVGVSKTGEVVFAMTEFGAAKYPNLFEFAELFRRLGCDDALFLDGDLSQMRSGDEMLKPSNNFGSMIAVTKLGAKQ